MERARKIVASKSHPLRISESLLSLVDSKASEDRTDRSTALRQLLYTGAEDYVIELLKRERISASRAAEILDVSLYVWPLFTGFALQCAVDRSPQIPVYPHP